MVVCSVRSAGVVRGLTLHSGAAARCAALVLELPFAFPVALPHLRQRPGDPGCLGDLQQPRAVSCLVLGQARLEVRGKSEVMSRVLVPVREMQEV
jgi:hypothetical protein